MNYPAAEPRGVSRLNLFYLWTTLPAGEHMGSPLRQTPGTLPRSRASRNSFRFNLQIYMKSIIRVLSYLSVLSVILFLRYSPEYSTRFFSDSQTVTRSTSTPSGSSFAARSKSPVFVKQEGPAYNGHFGCVCFHPIFSKGFLTRTGQGNRLQFKKC